jgi:hypothetical protein
MPQGYVWNAQNAPIEIKLSAKQIPAWIINNDGVARIPVTTRDGFYQVRSIAKNKPSHLSRMVVVN